MGTPFFRLVRLFPATRPVIVLQGILADLLVIIHLAFILFVVLGGLLVLRWPRAALIHLPAAFWGAIIEFNHWICPLTPVEQKLRMAAGEDSYSGGFAEHYLLPLIYPEGLTQEIQVSLGLFVLLVNVMIYGFWLIRLNRS